MPYSQFTTIAKAKQAFALTVQEGDRFIPPLSPIAPSDILSGTLKDSLPIVATSGSEKARSEGIIYPVLLEVRRILDRKISLFSGEDFTIDEAVGLNGVFDFLLTRSSEVLEIEAPAVVIVEAKKTDLKSGLGQCIAEMVAAQRFNQVKEKNIPIIYGSVSNGIQWQFIKLENQTVTIDLSVYPLPPVEQILSFFVWMMQNGAVNSETI
jgi:hypothetical protein